MRQVPAVLLCEELESRTLLSAFSLTPLVTFNGVNGGKPNATVFDSQGNLFGITAIRLVNGAVSGGEVFEVPHGSTNLQIVATLPMSNSLGLSLIVDSHDNLFGTTNIDGANGAGTIFEIPHGTTTLNILASFTQLSENGGQLNVVDSAGNLFGTDGGGLFELPAQGNTIEQLNDPDSGASVPNDLVMAHDGTLYGTTFNGGLNGDGSVFKILPGSNTPITIGSFDGMDNGANPLGISIDNNGDLFGITQSGGAFGFGTYFKVISGTDMISVITSFNGSQGRVFDCKGFLDPHNGNFFALTQQGGANGFGTVIEIPDGSDQPIDAVDLTSDEVAAGLLDGFSEDGQNFDVILRLIFGGVGNGKSPGGSGLILKLNQTQGGGGGGGGGGSPSAPNPGPQKIDWKNLRDTFKQDVREDTNAQEQAQKASKGQSPKSSFPAQTVHPDKLSGTLAVEFAQLKSMLNQINSTLNSTLSHINTATRFYNLYNSQTTAIARLNAMLAKSTSSAARARLQAQISKDQTIQSNDANGDTAAFNKAASGLDEISTLETNFQTNLSSVEASI